MDRRHFLKNTAGALAGGAALGGAASAQSPAQSTESDGLTTDRCGADCMVDVIKAIGLEYICANPGSSFRALCHGREAQGTSTGPRLGPDPMPLAQFTRSVRAPRNEMPPDTQKVLSDAALADIHAFVSSRPRPAR